MDFKKYEQMKAAGVPASDACLAGREGKLSFAGQVSMLRSVYGLSLGEAKQLSRDIGRRIIDHFEKYEQMKAAGAPASTAYLAAKEEGLDFAAFVRMLRSVYGLSMAEVKETMVVAHQLAPNLAAYHEKIMPNVISALDELDKPG